jgi:hypothetical protein
MATTTAFPSSSSSSHPHTQPQIPTQHNAQTQTQNSSDSGVEDTSSVFKAAIFQRLHPRVYLERFLAEDVRPDGRLLGTVNKDEVTGGGIWRDVSINVGMSLFRFTLFFFLCFEFQAGTITINS